MKKSFFVGLLCMLILGLVGCADTKKQEAVSDYVNNSFATLGALERDVLESFSSVVGDNYTNDNDLYTELELATISKAEMLNREAVNISGTLTEEEVIEVHELYVSYSSEFLSALVLLESAIEEQDSAMAAEANEMLGTANTYVAEYWTQLQNLADKYDVTISK